VIVMSESDEPVIELPEGYVTGAKRTNIRNTGSFGNDWFVGYGKDRSCTFEGSWNHMVVLALRILASENTKNLVEAVEGFPDEVYRPEFEELAESVYEYSGKPYEVVEDE